MIRPILPEEYGVLEDFLFLAIYVPPGSGEIPRSILEKPELQVYVQNFGRRDDCGFVAVSDGQIVGACWSRIMNDYGHIDDRTPSFAIAVLERYRARGIGTLLMPTLFAELARRGWKQLSMSVQKANRAVRFCRRLGFQVFREDEEEYVMVRELRAS